MLGHLLWFNSFERPSSSVLVIGSRFPWTMGGDLRRCVISGDFFAQLEDGESDGHNEREERELESVPGFQTQDTESQRDEGDGLEEDEDQDGDEDFLQLGFTG